MSEAGRGERRAGRESISLRGLFKLHVAANKPLVLDFPSGKVVMSVAEMKAALKDDKGDLDRQRP
ncbi:MAG TPA: hypothetical protein VMR21_07530 [Vicinamibacteria bacterium]|nr:hypothetical protein [Vicinamibacteria bacterium]